MGITHCKKSYVVFSLISLLTKCLASNCHNFRLDSWHIFKLKFLLRTYKTQIAWTSITQMIALDYCYKTWITKRPAEIWHFFFYTLKFELCTISTNVQFMEPQTMSVNRQPPHIYCREIGDKNIQKTHSSQSMLLVPDLEQKNP